MTTTNTNLFLKLSVCFLYIIGSSQQIVLQCSGKKGVTDTCTIYKGSFSGPGDKIISFSVDEKYEHVMFVIRGSTAELSMGGVPVHTVLLSRYFDTSKTFYDENCDYIEKDGTELGQDDKDFAYRQDQGINYDSISPQKIQALIDAENAKLPEGEKLKPLRFSAMFCGGGKLKKLSEIRKDYPHAPIEQKIVTYKHGSLVFSLTVPFVNQHNKNDYNGSKVYFIHPDLSGFPVLAIVCQGDQKSDLFHGAELISGSYVGRLSDNEKLGSWRIKSAYFFQGLSCGRGSLKKQGAFLKYDLPLQRTYIFSDTSKFDGVSYTVDTVQTFPVQFDRILI